MRLNQILFFAAAVLLFSCKLSAVTPGNVWYSGSIQGEITGSSEKEGREGSSDMYEFSHALTAEPAPNESCLAKGNREHFPVTIVKIIDRASPLLLKAWDTHERLTVTLRFYRIDPATRQEVNYYTITLRDAYISGIRRDVPLTFVPSNESYRHMERLSFTYGGYTEGHEAEALYVEDRWRNSCPQALVTDVNFDGIVNIEDFAIMAEEWLMRR